MENVAKYVFRVLFLPPVIAQFLFFTGCCLVFVTKEKTSLPFACHALTLLSFRNRADRFFSGNFFQEKEENNFHF